MSHVFYENIGHVGEALTGIATIFLAWAALGGFWQSKTRAENDALKNEAKDTNSKYKFEVANKAVEVINAIAAALMEIRNPFGYKSEIEAAEKIIQETNSDSTNDKIPLERASFLSRHLRFEKYNELFLEFEQLIPKFRVAFSDDTPLLEMRDIIQKINIALFLLIRHGIKDPTTDGLIYYTGEDDELQKRIKSIVNRVEAICASSLLRKVDE